MLHIIKQRFHSSQLSSDTVLCTFAWMLYYKCAVSACQAWVLWHITTFRPGLFLPSSCHLPMSVPSSELIQSDADLCTTFFKERYRKVQEFCYLHHYVTNGAQQYHSTKPVAAFTLFSFLPACLRTQMDVLAAGACSHNEENPRHN